MSEENQKSERFNQIIETLKQKSALKHRLHRLTCNHFKDFKGQLNSLNEELSAATSDADQDLKITYTDKGQFECELKFAGDILIFTLHTNIFSFNQEHIIYKSPYIQEDSERAYFGMIEIYNFIADSFKYQRLTDVGYLIARIFINKDNHFFVEGQEQFGFLFNDISNQKFDKETIRFMLEYAIHYTLQFDLWVPDYQQVQEISVGQKVAQTFTLNHKTGKRVGFRFQAEQEQEQ